MMDEHYSEQRDEEEARRTAERQAREKPTVITKGSNLREDFKVILTIQPKKYPNGGSVKDWKKWLASLVTEFGPDVRVQIHDPEGPRRKRRKG
jgi:hypothetical protein